MENQTLVKEICPTTSKELLNKGAVLVDVREKDEVEQLAFEVPNVIHIPLSEFDERYNEIPKDKDVVVACKAGARSLRAAGFLVNKGYSNAVNMQHGITRWVEKGFPTKGNTSTVSNTNSDCCSKPGCC